MKVRGFAFLKVNPSWKNLSTEDSKKQSSLHLLVRHREKSMSLFPDQVKHGRLSVTPQSYGSNWDIEFYRLCCFETSPEPEGPCIYNMYVMAIAVHPEIRLHYFLVVIFFKNLIHGTFPTSFPLDCYIFFTLVG